MVCPALQSSRDLRRGRFIVDHDIRPAFTVLNCFDALHVLFMGRAVIGQAEHFRVAPVPCSFLLPVCFHIEAQATLYGFHAVHRIHGEVRRFQFHSRKLHRRFRFEQTCIQTLVEINPGIGRCKLRKQFRRVLAGHNVRIGQTNVSLPLPELRQIGNLMGAAPFLGDNVAKLTSIRAAPGQEAVSCLLR